MFIFKFSIECMNEDGENTRIIEYDSIIYYKKFLLRTKNKHCSFSKQFICLIALPSAVDINLYMRKYKVYILCNSFLFGDTEKLLNIFIGCAWNEPKSTEYTPQKNPTTIKYKRVLYTYTVNSIEILSIIPLSTSKKIQFR